MTIVSMTGYGRATSRIADREVIWEIRSLNHRHLEIGVRMPDTLRFLEQKVRQLCRNKLQRGKIDIFLTIAEPALEVGDERVDWEKLDNLMALHQKINTRYHLQATPEPLALLAWLNTTHNRATDWVLYETALLSAFETALSTLGEMRVAEGAFLHRDLNEKLSKMADIVCALNQDMPAFFASLREKTQSMLQQISVTCEPERLEQEIALQAMRYDVAEEITRLEAHIARFRTLLETGQAVGRQLEFLLQEMHREANTLGNKGYYQNMTEQAMQLKVIIDQLREQSANVE